VAVVPPEDSEADTPAKDQQKSDVNEVYAEPIHELAPKAQRTEEAEEATNYDGSFMGEGELETGFLDDDLDFLDEEEDVYVSDPLEPWNRLMFQVNDKLYFWVMKPASTGYKAVLPGPVRTGVQNFFTNLTAPIRIVSCLVQGQGREAQAEFARFLLNSTIGVFGFGDPAKKNPELNIHDEDMGQALAVRGVDEGYYIVWPVLGPSTLRDTAGTVGDFFMNPISYLPLATSAGVTGEKKLNETSFCPGDYEALKKAAIDPYEAVRDAYIQHRQKKVEEYSVHP
jgi:phospholipid-binding lipoprotein MlaA